MQEEIALNSFLLMAYSISRYTFSGTQDEWIELDRENYKWRKAHIPYVYGYFKYTTNESFYEKTSEWAFNFVYSPPIFNELKSSFTKAATAIAVHCKGNGFDEELGLLKAYINKYCDQYLDDFGKEQFK